MARNTKALWSLLVGSVLIGFAYISSMEAGTDWPISIPIVFLLGDLLQIKGKR